MLLRESGSRSIDKQNELGRIFGTSSHHPPGNQGLPNCSFGDTGSCQRARSLWEDQTDRRPSSLKACMRKASRSSGFSTSIVKGDNLLYALSSIRGGPFSHEDMPSSQSKISIDDASRDLSGGNASTSHSLVMKRLGTSAAPCEPIEILSTNISQSKKIIRHKHVDLMLMSLRSP